MFTLEVFVILGEFHVSESFLNAFSTFVESDVRRSVRCPVNGIR